MRVANAGDVEDSRPPGDALDDLCVRLRAPAEHQVVGARLAGGHRRVSRRQSSGADDVAGFYRAQSPFEPFPAPIDMEPIDRGADRPCWISAEKASKAGA